MMKVVLEMPVGIALICTGALGLVISWCISAVLGFKAKAKKRDKTVLFEQGKVTFQELVIESIIEVTPEARRFRLKLPSPDMRAGLDPGQFFKVHCPNPLRKRAALSGKALNDLIVNGNPCFELGPRISRRYGMANPKDTRGFCEIVVKLYLPNEEYPDGGLLTTYLHKRLRGDTLLVSGPYGRVRYLGNGRFLVDGHAVCAKKLGMILGGTGVVPGFAIIQDVLLNPEDKTEMAMLYGSRNFDSVILREELEGFAAQHPDQFSLHLLLDDHKTLLAEKLQRKASMFALRNVRHLTDTHLRPLALEDLRSGRDLIQGLSSPFANVISQGTIPLGWSPAAHPTTSTATDAASREAWGGTMGRVTKKLIRKHFPPPRDDPLIFIIGPPGMLLNCVRPALRSLGYNLNKVLPF